MEFLATLLAICVLAAVWGIGIERHLYVVRRQVVKILPAGSKPITVLQIGDVHMAPWQKRKQKFIRSLAKLNPDMVVNTGDNLGHRDSIAATISAFTPLLQVPGVFVNGSNDYFAPVLRNPLAYLAKPSERSEGPRLETNRLTDAFTSAGWLNLNNREGKLVINGLRIGFLGVDDAHDDLDKLDTLAGQASQLADVEITFGVSHAPYRRVLEAMSASGAKLIFSGHTHGGQVCLPFVGALTTNCDLPNRNAKGLSEWNFGSGEVLLNVVAGLGHSIYAPVRFFCRPEVQLVTLTA